MEMHTGIVFVVLAKVECCCSLCQWLGAVRKLYNPGGVGVGYSFVIICYMGWEGTLPDALYNAPLSVFCTACTLR